MTVEEIYKSIDKILLKNIMLNDDAMKIMQSLGYNGFKRMHRCNIRELLECHIKLENYMFDKYRHILEVTPEINKYDPVNMKNHLDKWKQSLEEDIKSLGDLNYKHIEVIGISNCIVEDVLKELLHDYEKVCRYYARFNESNWNPIDIHFVDDNLHEKIKKYEEKL